MPRTPSVPVVPLPSNEPPVKPSRAARRGGMSAPPPNGRGPKVQAPTRTFRQTQRGK